MRTAAVMNRKTMTALTALALLGGCAETLPARVKAAHHRVSPPAVAPPPMAADAFDHARERQDLAAATAARAAAETAVAAWPVDIAAWEELEADCQALGDHSCQQYAAFFRAKLEYTSNLPVRVATLGFQTIAETPVGTRVDSMVYDQATIDMAQRLWTFCYRVDTVRTHSDTPPEESFSEKYPYAPALAVVGVGAGILSGIKSLANK